MTTRTAPVRATGDGALPDLPTLGRRVLWLPWAGGLHPVPVRGAVVGLLLLVVAAVAAVLAIGTGDYLMTPSQVVDGLLGRGHPSDVLVVREWRAPRTVLALALGAALGLGGAIFQSLTRNPLGSPDVIGFGTGAYSGALIAMLVLRGGFLATAVGSLVGGLATAVLVYALSLQRGQGGHSSSGFRLIITGIGVSAMLSSFNSWLVVNAEVEDAMRVAVWGAGSLTGITWRQTVPSLLVVAGIVGATVVLSRSLQLIEMGDDAAAALGIRVERSRLALMAVGIAAVALVAATTGPISFVALAAPQIARRLVHSSGPPLTSAAVTGAVLLLTSDLVAQRIHPSSPLPVGVVTVSAGGAYLVWLLIRDGRKAWRA